MRFEEALGVRQALGDDLGEIQTRLRIGMIHLAQEAYEIARSEFETGLAIAEKINNREGLIYFSLHLAGIYEREKNYPVAIELTNRLTSQVPESDPILPQVETYLVRLQRLAREDQPNS
jgi:tetratricopeptide (TPR) repeat protein